MKKIEETTARIVPLQSELFTKAQRRLDNLTKPPGSLGKLEHLAKRVIAITENLNPSLERKVVFVFAADHGVAEEGVSAYPQEVTCQMVYNFLKGGAAINVLARHVGARVLVTDVGVAADLQPHPHLSIKKVGYGTRNIAKEQAMTRSQAIQSVEVGIDVFENEYQKSPIDIMGTGDMGIANTTASSAVIAAMTGKDVKTLTGKGTGIDDRTWKKKVEVIKKALQHHCPDTTDPLDVLSKVGGYEIGAIAGCILAAARYKVPAVIDGFISTAGALIAAGLAPGVKEYLFASHLSTEKGHKVALEHLNLSPLLNLGLRLGEGTGACLAMSLIEASVKIATEMATFEQAGVSRETT